MYLANQKKPGIFSHVSSADIRGTSLILGASEHSAQDHCVIARIIPLGNDRFRAVVKDHAQFAEYIRRSNEAQFWMHLPASGQAMSGKSRLKIIGRLEEIAKIDSDVAELVQASHEHFDMLGQSLVVIEGVILEWHLEPFQNYSQLLCT